MLRITHIFVGETGSLHLETTGDDANFGASCLQRRPRLTDENDPDDWASAEFGDANLGDARLAQRLVAMARRLACSPQGSFPQSLKPAELKAAYRFFDNAQVDTNGILAPHIAQTLDRMSQVPVVLAVQDATDSTCRICLRPKAWVTALAITSAAS